MKLQLNKIIRIDWFVNLPYIAHRSLLEVTSPVLKIYQMVYQLMKLFQTENQKQSKRVVEMELEGHWFEE